MDAQPIRAEWLSDIGIAKHMGLTVNQVHALIADGTFTGELRRLARPGGNRDGSPNRREYIWWIPAREVEAEMKRRSALAEGKTEADELEWDTNGYRLDRPEPCVMYGLLTAADVTELERRRARMEALRTDVIPLEAVARELAAVG